MKALKGPGDGGFKHPNNPFCFVLRTIHRSQGNPRRQPTKRGSGKTAGCGYRADLELRDCLSQRDLVSWRPRVLTSTVNETDGTRRYAPFLFPFLLFLLLFRYRFCLSSLPFRLINSQQLGCSLSAPPLFVCLFLVYYAWGQHVTQESAFSCVPYDLG